jgi:hypothetical protein
MANFAVEEVSGADTYFWSVPDGTIITDGQYTNSITVNWGQNAGYVSVSAGNKCGTSDPQNKQVEVNLLPFPAGQIVGKDTVCLNHAGFMYSVPVISGAISYTWELPAGAYIISGEDADTIHVNFGPDAMSGLISVQGMNSCGAGTGSSMEINVKTCAGNPETEMNSHIQIYPNPTDQILNVTIRGMEKNLELSLLNVDGKMLYQRSWECISPEFHEQIDVSGLSKGIYLMKILNNDRVYFEKVILR